LRAPVPRQILPPVPDFKFHSELFAEKAKVEEALAALDFSSFAKDFDCVDCIHDLYGVEICGIKERKTVISILQAVRRLYPKWHGSCQHYDGDEDDRGWRVRVHRDRIPV